MNHKEKYDLLFHPEDYHDLFSGENYSEKTLGYSVIKSGTIMPHKEIDGVGNCGGVWKIRMEV